MYFCMCACVEGMCVGAEGVIPCVPWRVCVGQRTNCRHLDYGKNWIPSPLSAFDLRCCIRYFPPVICEQNMTRWLMWLRPGVRLWLRPGEMARQLKAIAFAENWISLPSTQRWFTTLYNSRSRGSYSLVSVGPRYAHNTETHIQTEYSEISSKSYFKEYE